MPDIDIFKSCGDRRVLHAGQSLITNPQLKVKQLANSESLSESRFRHLVAEKVGMTIRELKRRIRDEKLHEARRQLLETALPQKEIRHRAGYVHNSNFSRDFKKLFHRSPAEFRRSEKS